MNKRAGLISLLLVLNTLVFGQAHVSFFDTMQKLQGKTYFGKAVYMPDTTNGNDFWGKELSFTVKQLSGSELHLPFNVADNETRTWKLSISESGMRLKHEHRHLDGSLDSISNYGGDSDNSISTEFEQYFPADDFTAKLIPAASTNRWLMSFSPDKKKFYYILERNKIMRFKAEFNLE